MMIKNNKYQYNITSISRYNWHNIFNYKLNVIHVKKTIILIN